MRLQVPHIHIHIYTTLLVRVDKPSEQRTKGNHSNYSIIWELYLDYSYYVSNMISSLKSHILDHMTFLSLHPADPDPL